MQPASIGYFIALTVFYCALCAGLLFLAGSFELPFLLCCFRRCQLLIGDIGTIVLSPELIAETHQTKRQGQRPGWQRL